MISKNWFAYGIFSITFLGALAPSPLYAIITALLMVLIVYIGDTD
jgi:hypothetical protein